MSSVDAGANEPRADANGSSTLTDAARAGGPALVLSVVVNAALATVARMAGVGEGLTQLTYPPVLFFTAVGVVGATIVYAALDRLTNRPDRIFVIVAAVVLVLSVVPDFTYVPRLPGGSTSAGAVLASMHVLTAAIAVRFLVDRDALTQS